ncbi:NmrA-like family-domain-containing protein [Nemania sp. FL0916]|nr:NmrA-like family-domain-containing protein [Nemania sp. FL0916]
MAAKKVITVFGATGAQGGGIVSTFLSDPELQSEWAVRAVTRDPTKDSAKKLIEKGAEVFEADLDVAESIANVVKGSYAVYGVTNYWEKMSADVEVQQGKNLADAVKAAGVKHYIWSSLLDITELSKGALPNVYHFDSKAKVESYVRELGIPSTFFMPGFYMTGIPGEMLTSQGPSGPWVLALPAGADAQIPMYHPADTGKYIKAILQNADKLLGKRFLGATAYMTPGEIVQGFAGAFPASGSNAQFFQVPEDVFRGAMKGKGMPDFVVSELFENVKLMETFGYFGGESLDLTHELVKDHLTTWDEYVKVAPAFKGLS